MINLMVKDWNKEFTKVMNDAGLKTNEQKFDTDIENLLEKHMGTLEGIATEEDLYRVLDDDLPNAFEEWYVDHTPLELIAMLIKYYE